MLEAVYYDGVAFSYERHPPVSLVSMGGRIPQQFFVRGWIIVVFVVVLENRKPPQNSLRFVRSGQSEVRNGPSKAENGVRAWLSKVSGENWWHFSIYFPTCGRCRYLESASEQWLLLLLCWRFSLGQNFSLYLGMITVFKKLLKYRIFLNFGILHQFLSNFKSNTVWP